MRKTTEGFGSETHLYRGETLKAIQNFQVSGRPLPESLIKALAVIKRAWAVTNERDASATNKKKVFNAIAEAALTVEAGNHLDQFPVDVYQTGSGTSSNMNINEVLASLAENKSGLTVHPNDDVNRCQSSNDVFPSAMQIALLKTIRDDLVPAVERLEAVLGQKTEEFSSIVKVGRTHLQDATPITLGQEFSGYQAQIKRVRANLESSLTHLYALPLGGTAVGTGLNAPAPLVAETIKRLAEWLELPLVEAENHFEAQSAGDGIGIVSSALRSLGLALFKIGNDLRWLASGPNCGLGEILLPATQAGSSIMPAKVNPVQIESVLQVVARVIGNDATVAFAVSSGNFELNTMLPVMAEAVLDSARLLASVIKSFTTLCLEGLKADRERCRELVEKSLSLVTALAPRIGYERAARIANRAQTEKRSLRELLAQDLGIEPEELAELLDPLKMTLRPEGQGAEQ